ncbi:MAG: helicase-exonuclease AddAB subunit AddA [Clostridia bacterium]|nr:helicase-exonuclease AddAB subunit AddA [Clostridia bacterium]
MIKKILEQNINIDELLVVTFTNVAASEMRQRMLDAIYAYLEEHPEDTKMQEQIVKMGKANICTIHSFCLEVIRNHFYEIGVSPNIRIGKPNEMELLKRQVLEDLFEEKYEKEDKDFLLLIDTYTTYQRDDELKELVLSIFNTIQANPFPEEWLKEAVEEFHIDEGEDFANTKWGSILLEEVKEEIETCVLDLKGIRKELITYQELGKFTNTIEQDIKNLETILESIKANTNEEEGSCPNLISWDCVLDKVINTKWDTWPREKIESIQKEQAKEKRDQVKKKYNKIKDKFFISNSEQIRQDMTEMYEKLICLRNLIFEFETAFAKEKREKNVMDFHDIEHFALKILVKTDEKGEKRPTPIAVTYKEKFKEIAIDEYQDSNLIQEYILNMISNGNNLFMVGDVKQSIYKFRQARPELFLEKYETYQRKETKQEEDNLKIQLFKNFRSRENVLEVTNHVFENIMSKTLGEITYNKEEYLNLGANFPKIENQYKTSLHILNLKQPEEKEEELEQVENAVFEARFVANQIQSLVKNKFQVYDKKTGYRDICYKDMVILLRSTATVAPIFEKELNNCHIPVFSDTGNGYFDSIEIQTILSLLKIIDNPKQDIPFVSVLRSPIGKFDDNELIRIKLNGEQGKKEDFYTVFKQALKHEHTSLELKEKMKEFLIKLEEYTKKNEYMPLDEFIWYIYMETGYYQYVGLMPNGHVKQANLKILFERAKEYEKASFKGLFYFIAYINQLRRANSDMDSAKVISENEDVVRIMSIHKSKGLEFPVVILSATAKKFNLMDLNAPILLHQDLGMGPKYINEERKIEYPTLQKLAISAKVTKETLSEEMRILYVALTRAKEKLIITGVCKDFEKEMTKKKERLVLRRNKRNSTKSSKTI